MVKTNQKAKLRWYLAEWRERAKLTQEQLAEAVGGGTNKGQISKLETGSQRMNDDWILKLSRALQIEPADLLRPPPGGDFPALANERLSKEAVLTALQTTMAKFGMHRRYIDVAAPLLLQALQEFQAEKSIEDQVAELQRKAGNVLDTILSAERQQKPHRKSA